MDIKKNEEANLDNRRLEGFLLGLVCALSFLFAAFEYSTRQDISQDYENLLDDISADMDLVPAVDSKDMVSAAPSQTLTPLTSQVKEVKQVSSTEKISPITSKLAIGDGSAIVNEGDGKAEDSQPDEAQVMQALPQTLAENGDPVLRTVEKLPEFPGGMVEFMKWLTRNLRYPSVAIQQKMEGRVVVSFIVNKDGTIASPKLEKSVNPLLDAEAMRVIKAMPRWKAGIMNEKPCRTMIAIPINFKI